MTHRFLKSTATLILGTAIAQAFYLALAPIVYRQLPVENIGVFTVLQAWTGLFITVGALRFDAALLASDADDETQSHLFLLSIGLASLTSLLSLPIIQAALPFVAHLAPDLRVTGIFGLTALVSSVYAAAGYWNVRQGRYVAIAGTIATQALAVMCLQLFIARLHLGLHAVLLSEPASRGIALVIWSRAALETPLAALTPGVMGRLRRAARRYRRFPFFSVPGELVQQSTFQSLPIILSAAFGTATAAQFGVMIRAASAPVTLLSRSIGDVFARRTAIMAVTSDRALRGQVIRVYLAGCIPAVLAASLLLAFGPAMFAWFFGSAYSEAGAMAQAASPMIAAALVFSPTLKTMSIIGHQRTQAAWDVLLALTGIGGSLIVTRVTGDAHMTVRYFAWTYAALLALHAALVLRATRFSERETNTGVTASHDKISLRNA